MPSSPDPEEHVDLRAPPPHPTSCPGNFFSHHSECFLFTPTAPMDQCFPAIVSLLLLPGEGVMLNPKG